MSNPSEGLASSPGQQDEGRKARKEPRACVDNSRHGTGVAHFGVLGAGRPLRVMHGNGNRDGRGDYATHYQRISQK